MTGKLRVHRKGYKTKRGTRVKPANFMVKDRGKKGRTPKGKQWYNPQVHMGWSKEDDAETRRRVALNAHDGDVLSTARALDALAKVTTDRETKRLARADATYFFALNRKGG